MPKLIRTRQIPNSRNTSTRSDKSSTPVTFSELAVCQHLSENPMCPKNYSTDERFTIFLFDRWSFHLSALEAVYIKSCKPNLSRQKQFAYNLKLLRWSRV